MTARAVLAGIKAELAGITPGPWEFDGDTVCQKSGNYAEVIPTTVNCMSYCYGGSVQRPETSDATFIASAPATVARLSAAVEALLAIAESPDIITHHPKGDKTFYVEAHRIRAAIENALREGQ